MSLISDPGTSLWYTVVMNGTSAPVRLSAVDSDSYSPMYSYQDAVY